MDNIRNNRVFRITLIVLTAFSLLMMAGGWIKMAGMEDIVKNDVSKLMVEIDRACIVRPDSVTDKIPHRAVLVELVESLDDMTAAPAEGVKIAAAVVKDRQFSATGKIIALAFMILVCLSLVFGIRLLYVLIRKKKIPGGVWIFALCQVLLLLLVLLLCMLLNNHKDLFLSQLTAGGLFSPGEYGLDESVYFRPGIFVVLSAVTALAGWIIAGYLWERQRYGRIAGPARRASEPVESRGIPAQPDMQKTPGPAWRAPEPVESRGIPAQPDMQKTPAPASSPASEPFREPALNEPQILELTETEALFGTNKTITAPDGRKLKVHVPEGVKDGNIVRLKGYGEENRSAGKRDDLQVKIRIKKSPDNVVIR